MALIVKDIKTKEDKEGIRLRTRSRMFPISGDKSNRTKVCDSCLAKEQAAMVVTDTYPGITHRVTRAHRDTRPCVQAGIVSCRIIIITGTQSTGPRRL